MPSPDQEKSAKGLDAEQIRLRKAYVDLKDNIALCDIQTWLSNKAISAKKSGDSEMDNPVKKSLHHEQAKIYSEALKHIQDLQAPLD